MTKRYAVGIEFFGASYRGWQTQADGTLSIQQTLETALSKVANHPVALHAAGRTDAGVHALQMIAHFDSTAERTLYNWQRGTNALLPNDISIQWIQEVPNSFHARFNALTRRYHYIIMNTPHRPAVLNKRVTHVYTPLNLEPMQQATALLLGTHDFTSFRAAQCQSNQPIRHVARAHLYQQQSFIILDIEADGFLHHMVRNIVGCLIEIGTGNQPADWLTDLFIARDRRLAAPTAAPDGLYFVQATYPQHFNIPTQLPFSFYLN